MKVLFTTPTLEHPAAGGPQLRIENSLKALAKICDLSVVYRCRGALNLDHAAMEFFRSLCGDFVVNEFSGLSPNRYLRKLQRVVGIDAIRDADSLLRHVERTGATIVWFGFGNVSFPLIRRIQQRRPDLRLICDTDSVWSRFVLRELPYAGAFRRQTIRLSGWRKVREERSWVELCDVTTAVSEIDAEYYRSIASRPEKIHMFANVIDTTSYQLSPAPPPGFKKPAVYLAGTFGHYHSPMDTAARWMIDQVLPIVRRSMPTLHFYIVGKNSEHRFGHLSDPGITVAGTLPSVLPYLCNANVSLVPLHFESGTRFKILEAGACGVPIVSTRLGAEGLPVLDQEHLLIADSPEDFAKAIMRILNDPRLGAHLALNCRHLVDSNFSIETLARQGQAILNRLEQP
ncbi:MAG: glycosyltransferase [Candidatus Accumulibacter sp.]|uniref:glycosyltransferase family 4 protein n=1 Tax=Accumulibacter sp. TaxID=2053492 RepID=UPI001AD0717A|nr:glycosyltransferase family 4 protein [Accumulibacter sp.]MBN8438410.1 glycosyltransferase [Accumulibacter sp.]